MNISRKAVLAMVVLGGLLAFSVGIGTINSDVFAEDAPAGNAMVVKREVSSIWKYQTTCKETAEAVTTKDGKATTYKWETEKTVNTLIYFGDYDKKTDKWEILKSSRETSKLLKSYMAGDKDIKAAKEPFYRMFAGPKMYAGPADFMGKIEYAGPLSGKEWDDAVINHLPMLRKTTFKSGDNGTDKVVVEGKEVGEYSYRISGMLETTDMKGKIRVYYIRGTLQAKRDDGRTIAITDYMSKWEGKKSVPVMESWKMKIEYTTGNTKYSVEREYECQTLGAASTAVVLSSLDATRMNAQYKAFKTGYDALMLSNLTAETLQNRTVSGDKVLEAGKKYYEAYCQWPAGPFAEYILLWTENLNLLTNGAIMGADIGKPAPPISVAKWFNTKPIPASAYQGKVVIVEIFRPSCTPCRSAAPHLASLYKKYGAQGLMVVGLTKYAYSTERGATGPYTIESVISKYGATYPIAADAPTFVLFDKDGNLMKGPDRKYIKVARSLVNYPPRGVPHAYLIDRKGIVRWRGNPHPRSADAKQMAALLVQLLNEKP